MVSREKRAACMKDGSKTEWECEGEETGVRWMGREILL